MYYSSGKNTFGEALLALVGLGGFLLMIWQGKIQTWNDIILYTGILGVIVLFYFLVLLARAIFHFMVGNETFWWEKYEHHAKRVPKK